METEAIMEARPAGQVTHDGADIYQEFFVPALFSEWAGPVSDAAFLEPNDRVLDIACGTGVLAREAATRVGPGGTVVGLDRNPGMLTVAARVSPRIEWRLGRAEEMPFPDCTFDAVISQFGLMFFEDRIAALREMWRVSRPGGRIAVAVWDALDRTPGYAAMTELLQRLFGDSIADELRAPYQLGDSESLRRLFADAGITGPTVGARDGRARFPSIDAWVHTDIRGWTLANLIDDRQYAELLCAARQELQPFVLPDGRVEFGHSALIVAATKS
ncbi:MAG: methyltransferase domain-containing protein [Alphaproteobacteria bacterium]|nr:methyltransferase domain-containing protein [Alphaproteobacteria bacterium]